MHRRFVFVFIAILAIVFIYRVAHREKAVVQEPIVVAATSEFKNVRLADAGESEIAASVIDESADSSLNEGTVAVQPWVSLSDRYIPAVTGKGYAQQMDLLVQFQAHIHAARSKIAPDQFKELIQWDLLDAGVNYIRGIPGFRVSNCEDYKREFRLRFAPRIDEDDNSDAAITKSYELLDAVCK